jgi:ribose transport system permease protein
MSRNDKAPATLPSAKPRISRVALIPYIVLVALYAVMIGLQPKLLNLSWLGLKTNDALALILVSIAQTIVLLQGGIDLSVGGIVCVTNSIAALYMQDSLGSILLVSFLVLLLGTAIGALNGIAISKTRLQPFIVTLASWSIWGGVAIWILPIDGGSPPRSFVTALTARPGGFAVSLMIIFAFILWWLYFRRTRFGVAIYAVGSSEKAAHLNGINVDRTKIKVYALSGLFAAAAGLYRTAQVASGSPLAGNSFIMTSIVAAVIGGTSLAGGRGGVVGSIVGALILKLITDVLVFVGVSTYWSTLCQGLLLILAVIASSLGTLTKQRELRL